MKKKYNVFHAKAGNSEKQKRSLLSQGIQFFIVFIFFSSSTYVYGAEKFGIAMVGEPKYTAESSHLDYANPDAPKGGILKQAASSNFDTLNPYNIKGNPAQGLNLTTDQLMVRVWDEPFTLYPLIAEKIEVPADRSSITFTLNPKAQFHDDTPITADDVLFTFETLKEKGRPNQRRIYKMATATKINNRTIKFTLGAGHDRETVMIFGLMPVLSKAYWQGKEFDKTTLEPPLGSGPYKIKSVEVGKRITYERVADYWARDLLPNKGHHNFDEIIYDVYRDDTVALESFKKGDLSLRREWNAGNWHSNYKLPKITKEEIPHGRAEKVRGFIFNTRRAPFDDINVRRALNHFFDFDWMNKNLFYGAYKQVNSFYPNTYLSRESIDSPTLSPREKLREGNRLLEEAGWIIKNGKRVNKNTGKEMAFDILLDNPSDEKIALSLTRSLKKMGIAANVRVMDTAAFRARLNDYDFDMTLHFWHSTLSPGTEQYLYWSCEAAKTPAQWNYAGICDPDIDALAKAIPTAKTRTELVQNSQKLDQILWDNALMIPLYYNPVDYVAYWKPLKRPEITPLYGIVTETWWMEPTP